ncbi:phage terminase large subunit [Acetobacter sicerae]|uniref:phage terminase large subunit n=1 Tax=Acetobacter sicerae TaxID=85325 RepID=UPI00156AD9E3|nr:phage terminase large subunit [Acetobacter sicerae]
MVAKLNPRQNEANKLLGSAATHILLRGGSRSGKTFLLIRAICIRAMRAPETQHGIFRHRFNALKGTIIRDTFPKVMKLCFPGVPYAVNQTDWFVEFPNKSRIIFGGLDDKERTEKILGYEFATIYMNEASQIAYGARNMLVTRLAQKSGLALKEYIDANPPTTSHWLYQLFEQKIEPKSGEPLPDPDNYVTMQLNPDANRENLSPEYLAQLEALPERERRRFLYGEYQAAIDGAFWNLDSFKRDSAVTDENFASVRDSLSRIVVAVDPSGCSGDEDIRSDEIGISVSGLDWDGGIHILEDASGRYSPSRWASLVIQLFDKWQADLIVAERNYGGALVESNILAARNSAPIKIVTASRGKHIRAEPVANLYEMGRVVHHGRFPDLEEQLCQFSSAGFQGSKSPDRADAMVWGITELALGEDDWTSIYARLAD